MENGDLYVQWFPGHMARTRRQIKESLPLVDAVVEIVDARVPVSSRNPELPELIGQKPLMVILNKCDLADENATRRRISELGKQGVTAIAVDCRSGKGLDAFAPTVRRMLADKIEANAQKGMAGKPLRLMVVGIPNTGKSSFINRMAGKNKAKLRTSPESRVKTSGSASGAASSCSTRPAYSGRSSTTRMSVCASRSSALSRTLFSTSSSSRRGS